MISLSVARCISNRTQSYFAVKCSGFFMGTADNAMHGNGRWKKNQSKSWRHDLKVLSRLFWGWWLAWLRVGLGSFILQVGTKLVLSTFFSGGLPEQKLLFSHKSWLCAYNILHNSSIISSSATQSTWPDPPSNCFWTILPVKPWILLRHSTFFEPSLSQGKG